MRMGLKHYLILTFLLTTFNSFSQKVSIGESRERDSVYLEFNFPRKIQIEIYKGNEKITTIPEFVGVKWFHLKKSTKYLKIIEIDPKTVRLIFLTDDTVLPKGRIIL